jgi:hypothetical protein
MADIAPSTNKVIEAEMKSAAMNQLLASQDFVTASDIASLGNFSVEDPNFHLDHWKRLRLTFAIHHNGSDYYPLYTLDPANGYRPLPVVADVLQIFAESKDSWGVAFWFGSVNSYLSSRRPQDVLNTDRESLLRAARAESEGFQHG